MYSTKTVGKVVKALKKWIEFFLKLAKTDINLVNTCISEGNRKIGHVLNVSLAPIITCANCKQCKHFCYDVKACLQYSNTVLQARARNTVLALYFPEKYFSDIRKKTRWPSEKQVFQVARLRRYSEHGISH